MATGHECCDMSFRRRQVRHCIAWLLTALMLGDLGAGHVCFCGAGDPHPVAGERASEIHDQRACDLGEGESHCGALPDDGCGCVSSAEPALEPAPKVSDRVTAHGQGSPAYPVAGMPGIRGITVSGVRAGCARRACARPLFILHCAYLC